MYHMNIVILQKKRMVNISKFDDIRPYNDEEFNAAIKRIVNNPHFDSVAKFVYPDRNVSFVKDLLLSIRTIYDFQLNIMKKVNEQIISNSISNFTYSGFEHIFPRNKYLFISNHRDIMLDACLLQYALYKYGHERTEISFGSNLMKSQFLVDIGKCNKMYKIERGGSPREMYNSSMILSEYIHYTLTEKKESMWIAQRNGRTKDGNDKTEHGIIKMLCMGSNKTPQEALAELNIVPVSISYEWEPCDFLKATELYKTRREKYIKGQNEDLNSIITGIKQSKGNVHIEICEPLSKSDIFQYNNCSSNEFFKNIAQIIEDRIIKGYMPFSNNYIAYDILNECYTPGKYSSEQKKVFVDRLKQMPNSNMDANELNDILLNIYANPIKSKNKF